MIQISLSPANAKQPNAFASWQACEGENILGWPGRLFGFFLISYWSFERQLNQEFVIRYTLWEKSCMPQSHVKLTCHWDGSFTRSAWKIFFLFGVISKQCYII